MFDFAISRNSQQRPSRRFFASCVISCIFHLILVTVLIEFPQLLRGGMYHRFRPLAVITNLLSPKADDDTRDWRTVAVLNSPMIEPSAAELRKLMGQVEKETVLPPSVLNLGDLNARRKGPSAPVIRQESKGSLPLPPPNTATAGVAGTTNTETPGGLADARTGVPDSKPDNEGGNKSAAGVSDARPSAPKPEIANNAAPASIPNGIRQPANTQPQKDPVKGSEDEQKAIRSTGSGFFDTKGFPLGDYKALIEARIKGNWFIPSYLKNSQGHTTIIFYIGRDGRFSKARIEPSASSGNTSLDLAALKAIMDSNPFPPLPKGFPGDYVGAKFVLSYNEP